MNYSCVIDKLLMIVLIITLNLSLNLLYLFYCGHFLHLCIIIVLQLYIDLHTSAMDSGWAWVICTVAFFSNFLILGFNFTLGVYFVEFLNVFGQSKGMTALISSFNFGAFCFIGLLNISQCHEQLQKSQMVTLNTQLICGIQGLQDMGIGQEV